MIWFDCSRAMDEERTHGDVGNPCRGISALQRRLDRGPSKFAVIGLLGLVFAGCAAATSPSSLPAAAIPVEEPLDEADIQLVSSLIALSDRRAFDSAVMSTAAVSPRASVRRQVAYAAARIGGDPARSLARHLLADPDSTVAAIAAFAIGELADSSAVSLLSQRLLMAVPAGGSSIRAQAAEALGKIGDDSARAAVGSYLLTADTLATRIEPAVVGAALLAGWRAGIADSAPFARWASSPDAEVRWRAVYALTRRRHADAVTLLRSLLADEDSRVRAMALRGLQRPLLEEAGVPIDSVLSELMPLLTDPAYPVRIEAIRTLATYGPGPALDKITEIAAAGEDTHGRAAAIEALGRSAELAMAAAPLLTGIALDPGAHEFHRELAIDALALVDEAAASANLPVLLGDAREWRVRAAAGRALATLSSADPLPVARAVRDTDPRVGAATLLALSEREDSASLRPFRSLLVEALGARDLHLRANAVTALGRIADAALLPSLLDAYATAQADSVPDARLAAIEAIAGLKERGVPFPERVFFARFGPPGDYLTIQRARARFEADARGAWPDPFPLEDGASPEIIDWVVRSFIAPARADSIRPMVRIETSRGDLLLELFPEEAPLTVANFLDLARNGFFDGGEWPRVVPNFVVQGGDPRGDTSGGSSRVIRDEMNALRYTPGTVGMALAGPDTGSSQFFITHTDQPHLDGTYTVFGRLLSGQTVLEQLITGDALLRVTVVPDSTSNE